METNAIPTAPVVVGSWASIVRTAKANAARLFVTPGEAKVFIDSDPCGTGISL